MEQKVIAGMPVDQSEMIRLGMPTIQPYPDSIQVSCENCSRAVWLGPEQQKARDREGWPVYCYLCLTQHTHADEVELRPLSHKQTTVGPWPFKRGN
jgi:hypothetical protein